jgi:hypothetical protein
MSEPRVVACPTCGNPVVWQAESRWRPFCCERCRLIDLGEWASESRRIPVDDASTDFESDPDTLS